MDRDHVKIYVLSNTIREFYLFQLSHLASSSSPLPPPRLPLLTSSTSSPPPPHLFHLLVSPSHLSYISLLPSQPLPLFFSLLISSTSFLSLLLLPYSSPLPLPHLTAVTPGAHLITQVTSLNQNSFSLRLLKSSSCACFSSVSANFIWSASSRQLYLGSHICPRSLPLFLSFQLFFFSVIALFLICISFKVFSFVTIFTYCSLSFFMFSFFSVCIFLVPITRFLLSFVFLLISFYISVFYFPFLFLQLPLIHFFLFFP